MARCFVIQPFDRGGPYDKRYRDVLTPAIQEAGLEPYRVVAPLVRDALMVARFSRWLF
jgi:hypothetical protein